LKPVLHITWEYPPFVVGSLSLELRKTLEPLAREVPVNLVVRADSDETTEMDGMKVYKVSQSIKSSPHVLAYAHVLNIDLVRGACRAIHESGGVSLVHCHDWISSLAGVYISSNFCLPLVISVYSTELIRSRSLSTLLSMGIFDLERHCLRKADAVVADASFRESLTKDYGVDPGRIFPSGSDLLGLYSRWAMR
jgi:glycogen(starch) synthase